MEGPIWNQRKPNDLIVEIENLKTKLKSRENLVTKFYFSLEINICSVRSQI